MGGSLGSTESHSSQKRYSTGSLIQAAWRRDQGDAPLTSPCFDLPGGSSPDTSPCPQDPTSSRSDFTPPKAPGESGPEEAGAAEAWPGPARLPIPPSPRLKMTMAAGGVGELVDERQDPLGAVAENGGSPVYRVSARSAPAVVFREQPLLPPPQRARSPVRQPSPGRITSPQRPRIRLINPPPSVQDWKKWGEVVSPSESLPTENGLANATGGFTPELISLTGSPEEGSIGALSTTEGSSCAKTSPSANPLSPPFRISSPPCSSPAAQTLLPEQLVALRKALSLLEEENNGLRQKCEKCWGEGYKAGFERATEDFRSVLPLASRGIQTELQCKPCSTVVFTYVPSAKPDDGTSSSYGSGVEERRSEATSPLSPSVDCPLAPPVGQRGGECEDAHPPALVPRLSSDGGLIRPLPVRSPTSSNPSSPTSPRSDHPSHRISPASACLSHTTHNPLGSPHSPLSDEYPWKRRGSGVSKGPLEAPVASRKPTDRPKGKKGTKARAKASSGRTSPLSARSHPQKRPSRKATASSHTVTSSLKARRLAGSRASTALDSPRGVKSAFSLGKAVPTPECSEPPPTPRTAKKTEKVLPQKRTRKPSIGQQVVGQPCRKPAVPLPDARQRRLSGPDLKPTTPRKARARSMGEGLGLRCECLRAPRGKSIDEREGSAFTQGGSPSLPGSQSRESVFATGRGKRTGENDRPSKEPDDLQRKAPTLRRVKKQSDGRKAFSLAA